jgi:hypothetical protein
MMDQMRTETCPSYTYRIWIGGDYDKAVDACRAFTMMGLCVALQKVDYVYTMGMEAGICVTLMNYPRLPFSQEKIERIATELGHDLCEKLHQGSFSIEGPTETVWYSRRAADQIDEKKR